MTTLAPVIPLQRQATPDPCEILAGLMIEAGVGPAEIDVAAATLAEIVPPATMYRAGMMSAYWRLTATAS